MEPTDAARLLFARNWAIDLAGSSCLGVKRQYIIFKTTKLAIKDNILPFIQE